jgi:hypothetical protein
LVLLIVSYTDSSVTATLWGTDPGYVVKSQTGAWSYKEFKTEKEDDPDEIIGEEKVKQAGVNGKQITVTRWVYDKQGNLLRQGSFHSVYDPVTEILLVGTKEAPPPADETGNETDTNGGTGSGGSGTGGEGGSQPASGGDDATKPSTGADSGSGTGTSP